MPRQIINVQGFGKAMADARRVSLVSAAVVVVLIILFWSLAHSIGHAF